MNRIRSFLPVVAAAVAATMISSTLTAQIERRRVPGPDVPATTGPARNARFPYAGSWIGTRTMPVGSDEIHLTFSAADGKYTGAMVFPGGGLAPHRKLATTAAGLTWESPNSGGGTWVYHVRLAGPDSMVGTLVLRDAPANFTPVPRGTLVLTRPTDAPRAK